MRDACLEELTDTECHNLLAERHLGRLALVDAQGPVILPVNYVFDQGSVVFRTDPGAKPDAAADDTPVAFEVDAVDEGTRTGSSVVVRGSLAEVSDLDDLERLRTLPLYRGRLAPRRATCACSPPWLPAAASPSRLTCPSPGGAEVRHRSAVVRRW